MDKMSEWLKLNTLKIYWYRLKGENHDEKLVLHKLLGACLHIAAEINK